MVSKVDCIDDLRGKISSIVHVLDHRRAHIDVIAHALEWKYRCLSAHISKCNMRLYAQDSTLNKRRCDGHWESVGSLSRRIPTLLPNWAARVRCQTTPRRVIHCTACHVRRYKVCPSSSIPAQLTHVSVGSAKHGPMHSLLQRTTFASSSPHATRGIGNTSLWRPTPRRHQRERPGCRSTPS